MVIGQWTTGREFRGKARTGDKRKSNVVNKTINIRYCPENTVKEGYLK